jgi:hypothetical protein
MAVATVDGRSAPISVHEALKVADMLSWSVAPKAADEVGQLAALLPRIIRGLTLGMTPDIVPEARRRRVSR